MTSYIKYGISYTMNTKSTTPNKAKQAFTISLNTYNSLRKFKELKGVPYSQQIERGLRMYWGTYNYEYEKE